MKVGDLVKFTFAASSSTFNKKNKWQYALLIKEENIPFKSWTILLSDGTLMHADYSELELALKD